ncbi:MAG: tagatose 1,6-diphosphate aldolase [Acetobacteraceae bacterium]|nr:tagatose 1,6-diphosphate aldolase [Acetobacteraceae bacterium]
MPMTPGKRWGLRRLADPTGRFRMLAADQRPPIFQAIARAYGIAPEAVPFAEVCAVKRLLVEELGPHADAVLLDPNFAYPAAIDALPACTGLILTLEEHRFEETPGGRRSRSIPGWDVGRIKRLGADGVKVLAWYRPDAAPEILAHQRAYVRAVGRDCAALDIPFILELLVYPFPGEAAHHADYAEDAAKQAALVLESVRHFAAPEFGVDLFKLECPLPAAALPAPEDAAGCDRLRSLFASMAEATGGRPWVMLSAGAAPEQFLRVLEFAYAAGASGFLAGRAIWWQALQDWPDAERCRARLRSEALPYLRALSELTTRAARPADLAGPGLAGIAREGDFVASIAPLGT